MSKDKNIERIGYLPYEVKDQPIQYGECCYAVGETAWIHKNDIHCFLKPAKEVKIKECFPEYCTFGANGAWPTFNYTNGYCLPAGVPVVATVPVLENCAPPT